MKKINILIKNENILKNLDFIKNETKKEILFVVKNNAYNTGILATCSLCFQHDYHKFAVCTIEEALKVRSVAKDA